MEIIKELSIDLETFSDVDIKKCGAYKYTESDAFEILLFAVSVNNGPVQVYDLACGEQIPKLILDALQCHQMGFQCILRARLPLPLPTAEPSGILLFLQHPGRYCPRLSESRILAMLHDLVRLHGTATLS